MAAAGADHGGSGAHPPAPAITAAIVLSMGWSMPAAARVLLSLAAWFTTPRRGVATLLEELLLARGKDKFLTAVATGK